MNIRNDLNAWSKIPGWKPNTPTAAAHATNLPAETFTQTERSSLQAGLLQGQVAKKLGATPSEVQVTDSSFTFTGKALEKVQASMRELAANTSAGLAGCPAGVLGCKQLAIHAYQTPEGGKAHLDYPSHIVTNPEPNVPLSSRIGYLLT